MVRKFYQSESSSDGVRCTGKWNYEGSFKVLIPETVGIDNPSEGLIGIFYGKNKGKAVLKF
ncbi:hypothetical protein N7527_003049 [Penicillium freii]|nr:hypothetical protein N7527_003049 [Penicillium freii]